MHSTGAPQLKSHNPPRTASPAPLAPPTTLHPHLHPGAEVSLAAWLAAGRTLGARVIRVQDTRRAEAGLGRSVRQQVATVQSRWCQGLLPGLALAAWDARLRVWASLHTEERFNRPDSNGSMRCRLACAPFNTQVQQALLEANRHSTKPRGQPSPVRPDVRLTTIYRGAPLGVGRGGGWCCMVGH